MEYKAQDYTLLLVPLSPSLCGGASQWHHIFRFSAEPSIEAEVDGCPSESPCRVLQEVVLGFGIGGAPVELAGLSMEWLPSPSSEMFENVGHL